MVNALIDTIGIGAPVVDDAAAKIGELVNAKAEGKSITTDGAPAPNPTDLMASVEAAKAEREEKAA